LKLLPFQSFHSRDGDVQEHVVTNPLEVLMGLDHNVQVKIACTAASQSWRPVPRDSHSHARINSRRYGDIYAPIEHTHRDRHTEKSLAEIQHETVFQIGPALGPPTVADILLEEPEKGQERIIEIPIPCTPEEALPVNSRVKRRERGPTGRPRSRGP
jgi:hypothetical protein